MEYQKIMKLLGNTRNQPYTFRTRNWIELNDESKGKYDNSIIRFKTSMIRSYLCDYSVHSYLLREQQQLRIQQFRCSSKYY